MLPLLVCYGSFSVAQVRTGVSGIVCLVAYDEVFHGLAPNAVYFVAVRRERAVDLLGERLSTNNSLPQSPFRPENQSITLLPTQRPTQRPTQPSAPKPHIFNLPPDCTLVRSFSLLLHAFFVFPNLHVGRQRA